MLLLSVLLVSLTLGHISCFKAAPGRIIGGQNAAEGQFPYLVSVQKFSSPICGGSIISPLWIVTSAHCIVGKNPEDMQIVAGTTDLTPGIGEMFGVEQLVAHPKYNKVAHDWDLGLIKVDQPIPFYGSVAKIDLAPVNTPYTANATGTISGFGRINSNNDRTTKLKYANSVPLWDMKRCVKTSQIKITDRMFCAGYTNGLLNPCSGDSGGPFTLNGTLFGISSWSRGCGDAGPSGFAYVAAFRDWIKKITGV